MVEETAGFSGVSSYRACNRLRTYTDSPTLGSSTGAAAGRASVAYREKSKCLASGRVLGDSSLLDKTPEDSSIAPLLSSRQHRVVISYLRLHQPGSQGLPCPGHYLMLHPIHLQVCFSTIAMLLRQRVKAALYNMQKQTQGGCQNAETKEYGPNERIEQNSIKRTNQNGDKRSIRYKVQNTGY